MTNDQDSYDIYHTWLINNYDWVFCQSRENVTVSGVQSAAIPVLTRTLVSLSIMSTVIVAGSVCTTKQKAMPVTSLSSTINRVKIKESSMTAATPHLTTNKRNVSTARLRDISKANDVTNKSYAVTRLQTISKAKAKATGLQRTIQSNKPRFTAKKSSVRCKTHSSTTGKPKAKTKFLTTIKPKNSKVSLPKTSTPVKATTRFVSTIKTKVTNTRPFKKTETRVVTTSTGTPSTSRDITTTAASSSISYSGKIEGGTFYSIKPMVISAPTSKKETTKTGLSFTANQYLPTTRTTDTMTQSRNTNPGNISFTSAKATLADGSSKTKSRANTVIPSTEIERKTNVAGQPLANKRYTMERMYPKESSSSAVKTISLSNENSTSRVNTNCSVGLSATKVHMKSKPSDHLYSTSKGNMDSSFGLSATNVHIKSKSSENLYSTSKANVSTSVGSSTTNSKVQPKSKSSDNLYTTSKGKMNLSIGTSTTKVHAKSKPSDNLSTPTDVHEPNAPALNLSTAVNLKTSNAAIRTTATGLLQNSTTKASMTTKESVSTTMVAVAERGSSSNTGGITARRECLLKPETSTITESSPKAAAEGSSINGELSTYYGSVHIDIYLLCVQNLQQRGRHMYILFDWFWPVWLTTPVGWLLLLQLTVLSLCAIIV